MIGMLIATALFTTTLLFNVNTKDSMRRPLNDTPLILSGFIGGIGMVGTVLYGSFEINSYYALMAAPSIFIFPHLLFNIFSKGPILIWSILFNIIALFLSLSSL